MLAQMEVLDAFGTDLHVPSIDSLPQVNYVLRDVQLFRSQQEEQRTMQLLESAGLGAPDRLSIGVKKLLSITEMARQDPDGAGDKLLTSLMELSAYA